MSETIKVRFKAAVTPDGKWAASGWGHEDGVSLDDDDMAIEMLPSDAERWHVVEVEVELPVPTKIADKVKGTVVEIGDVQESDR